MHEIYLGYSKELSSREIIRYFDIDPNHPESLSKFEQEFGADYIEPGSFEVYAKKDFKEVEFDRDLFAKLTPFSPKTEWLNNIDFAECKCAFFIKSNRLKNLRNHAIKLFGPYRIIKFDFE